MAGLFIILIAIIAVANMLCDYTNINDENIAL